MTVPAAPAPAGAAAWCTRPQRARHRVQVMLDHPRRRQWDLHLQVAGHHPRPAAPARALPHSHVPAGKCGTVSSGCSLQARCEPGAPGCPPGFRFPPRAGLRRGAGRPGRSSADGGIDELPLLREASRSSRSTRAARSATCPASPAFSAASTPITRPCTAITASRAASSGIGGTRPSCQQPGRDTLPADRHRGPRAHPPPLSNPALSFLARSATVSVNSQGQLGTYLTTGPYLA